MIHRSPPALQAVSAALPALLLIGLGSPAWADTEVEAHLSTRELQAIQPLELTLTAVATDGPAASPDLSVLEADFQVLDRRIERRVSVTNGERREEVRLYLMLLPRRAGDLELPGIPFGTVQTKPLQLSVKSGAYFRAFGSALPDHLNDRPQDWGQGTKGYMTRVGDRFARFTISSAIQNAGQYALGHDPRYVRCKCDGFWPRFGHATALSFMTYDRNGKKVFNVMNFAGAFGSEYIAGQWTPGTNPTVAGYQGAVQQIGAGWIFNVLREFGPEMKRAFTRKK
ncbi:MAG: BatD family protein [Bryobacter sp.]|nr:BatD family protein [Bryobacter sp.]